MSPWVDSAGRTIWHPERSANNAEVRVHVRTGILKTFRTVEVHQLFERMDILANIFEIKRNNQTWTEDNLKKTIQEIRKSGRLSSGQ
jgi:hypothetical protein